MDVHLNPVGCLHSYNDLPIFIATGKLYMYTLIPLVAIATMSLP